MHSLYYYSCPNFFPFSPAPSSAPIPAGNPHTITHVLASCMLFFSNPVPFCPPVPSSPHSSYSCQSFHVSVPLILFCLLVYYVHYVLLISEVIYLPFIDWLISLSIIVSSFIQAFTKSKNSFLFLLLYSIQLCLFTTAFFYPLTSRWAVRLFANLGYCK